MIVVVVVLVVFVEAVAIAGYEVRKPRYTEFVAAVSVDVAPLLKEMLSIAVGAIVTGVVTGVVKRVVAGTDLNGYQGGK